MTGTNSQDPDRDLLLREIQHRASNDLQLVVSLLGIQSRRAASAEVRTALEDAKQRVGVLARSRAELNKRSQASILAALRHVGEGLSSQTEPAGIQIVIDDVEDVPGIPPDMITSLALTVNELVTNAIKHAFRHSHGGQITVTARKQGSDLVITVDDDGLPFPTDGKGHGMGLNLVTRLLASLEGEVAAPPSGSKVFKIRVPMPGPASWPSGRGHDGAQRPRT